MALDTSHRSTVTVDARVESLERGMNKAAKKINKLERELEKTKKKSDEASKGLDKLEKGFDGISKSIGKATKILGAAGLVGAAVGAVSKLDDLVQSSIKFNAIMNNLPFSIDGAVKSTQGLVDKFTLAQSAVAANRLGVAKTEEEFAQLTEAATKLGLSVGQDAATSVQNLTEALGKGSTQVLDNLGIVLKAGDAQKEYAKRLGKTTAELTDIEKAEAFRVIGLEKAIKASKGITLELDEGLLKWQETKLALEDIGNRALPLVAIAAEKVVDELEPLINTLEDGTAVIERFGQAWEGLSEKFPTLTGHVGDSADAFGEYLDLVDPLTIGINLLESGMSLLDDATEALIPSTRDLEDGSSLAAKAIAIARGEAQEAATVFGTLKRKADDLTTSFVNLFSTARARAFEAANEKQIKLTKDQIAKFDIETKSLEGVKGAEVELIRVRKLKADQLVQLAFLEKGAIEATKKAADGLAEESKALAALEKARNKAGQAASKAAEKAAGEAEKSRLKEEAELLDKVIALKEFEAQARLNESEIFKLTSENKQTILGEERDAMLFNLQIQKEINSLQDPETIGEKIRQETEFRNLQFEEKKVQLEFERDVLALLEEQKETAHEREQERLKEQEDARKRNADALKKIEKDKTDAIKQSQKDVQTTIKITDRVLTDSVRVAQIAATSIGDANKKNERAQFATSAIMMWIRHFVEVAEAIAAFAREDIPAGVLHASAATVSLANAIAFSSQRIPGKGGTSGGGGTNPFAGGGGGASNQQQGGGTAQTVPGSQSAGQQNADQNGGGQNRGATGGTVNIGTINVTGTIDEDTSLKIKQGLENLDHTRLSNA